MWVIVFIQLLNAFNGRKLISRGYWWWKISFSDILKGLGVKGALTYFLGCVAKEYVCGITWKFFATHRSFYNTALVINIEIEQ